MSIISENLKKARKAKDLSQDKAAKLLQIPRPRLASYEEGRAHPPMLLLLRFNEVYDIADWHDFLTCAAWRPGYLTSQGKPLSLIEKRYAALDKKQKALVDILLNLA